MQSSIPKVLFLPGVSKKMVPGAADLVRHSSSSSSSSSSSAAIDIPVCVRDSAASLEYACMTSDPESRHTSARSGIDLQFGQFGHVGQVGLGTGAGTGTGTKDGGEPLPRIFKSRDSWPKKTSLLCWNCSAAFDTVPVFMPEFIEVTPPDRTEHNIRTSGVFCTFYCARSFVYTHTKSRSDQIEQMCRLKLLFKIFNGGASMSELAPLISPYTMTKYGGKMSEEEFARHAIEADRPDEHRAISRSF